MTSHADLVERAVSWLRKSRGCGVVLWERSSAARETPDAIGWKAGFSTLVEVKVSRGDFFADQWKPTRRRDLEGHVPGGMGRLRYYLTPPGLLDPAELDACGWGLLEAGRQVRLVRESRTFEAGLREEVRLLTSELRLIHLAQAGYPVLRTKRAEHALRGLENVRWKEPPPKPKASPSPPPASWSPPPGPSRPASGG